MLTPMDIVLFFKADSVVTPRIGTLRHATPLQPALFKRVIEDNGTVAGRGGRTLR